MLTRVRATLTELGPNRTHRRGRKLREQPEMPFKGLLRVPFTKKAAAHSSDRLCFLTLSRAYLSASPTKMSTSASMSITLGTLGSFEFRVIELKFKFSAASRA